MEGFNRRSFQIDKDGVRVGDSSGLKGLFEVLDQLVILSRSAENPTIETQYTALGPSSLDRERRLKDLMKSYMLNMGMEEVSET